MNEPKFKRGDKVRLKIDNSPDLIVNGVYRAVLHQQNEIDGIDKITYACIYVDDDDKIQLTSLAEEIIELDE